MMYVGLIFFTHLISIFLVLGMGFVSPESSRFVD